MSESGYYTSSASKYLPRTDFHQTTQSLDRKSKENGCIHDSSRKDNFHLTELPKQIHMSEHSPRGASLYGFNVPTNGERLRTRSVYSRKLYRRSQSNNANENDEEITAALITAGFTEKTTSHGIPHIYFALGFLKKFLWTIITIAATVALCLHLYWLVTTFLEYEINTSIRLKQERLLNFPAVSICNHNSIRQSALRGDDSILARINRKQNKTDKFSEIYRNELIEELKEEFALMDQASKEELGHDIDDMLLFCTFNGKQCEPGDFWYFFNPTYGNCVTFNSGLSLVLNVEQYEYMPFLTQAAGARIVVHNQTEMPFPEIAAFSVNTNQMINIGLRKSIYSRQGGGLYSNCTNEHDSKNNIYHDVFNVQYTISACLKTCVQKEIVKTCGCFDPNIPYKSDSAVFMNIPNATVCSDANEVTEHCMEDIQEQFIDGRIPCSYCHDPCLEAVYTPATSYAAWPADSYMSDFIGELTRNYRATKQKLDHESLKGLNIPSEPVQVTDPLPTGGTEQQQQQETTTGQQQQGTTPAQRQQGTTTAQQQQGTTTGQQQQGTTTRQQQQGTGQPPQPTGQQPPPAQPQLQQQPQQVVPDAVTVSTPSMQTTASAVILTDEERQSLLEATVKRNLLQINVYFESLQVSKFDEQPSYNTYQFVSDLGGAFGLWVGWSIITMVEMIEIVADLLVFLGLRRAYRGHR